MTERRDVPHFDTVSNDPRTRDQVHFNNCVWTLVVTDGKVTFQDVPPDQLSYTLEGFRVRMSEVMGCITKIEPAKRH